MLFPPELWHLAALNNMVYLALILLIFIYEGILHTMLSKEKIQNNVKINDKNDMPLCNLPLASGKAYEN
jgi:hypothetical protein